MLFKRFLIWSFGSPPVQWSGATYAIMKEGIMENIHVKLYEIGPVVQEEMSFKGISYLKLWQPFCSAKRNHLCNFGGGYQEEQFCEIILNLGQVFRRRCLLKEFLSGALATSQNSYAILKEGIMGNIHVKLYEIRTSCGKEILSTSVNHS